MFYHQIHGYIFVFLSRYPFQKICVGVLTKTKIYFREININFQFEKLIISLFQIWENKNIGMFSKTEA